MTTARKSARKAPTDAQRLTARRKALGLSQQAVADRVGVTLRTYQRWEEPAHDLSAMRLALRLAEALETTPRELLGEDGEGPTRSTTELEMLDSLRRVEALLAALVGDQQTAMREAAELLRQELGEPERRKSGRSRRQR
jgi:transcriptional regulator with XRE-family HTH domain